MKKTLDNFYCERSQFTHLSIDLKVTLEADSRSGIGREK